MIDTSNRHLPSPEFRASLERDVMQAFRRQSQFDAPPSMRRRNRLRTAATLLIGLTLGAGTAVATAQVQNAKVRDSLTLDNQARRKIALLRVDLANSNVKEVLKAVQVGIRAETDAYYAQHEAMIAAYDLKRVELEAEEIRATSAAPRDELWAPLVDGRDFVTERLNAALNASLERQGASEQRQQQLFDRKSAGLIREFSDADMELMTNFTRAAGNSNVLIMKRELRRRFLNQEITEKELPGELQLLEVDSAVRSLLLRASLAEQRAKRANDRERVGQASLIDVKRAELEVLESSQDLQQAQRQLKMLKAAQPIKKND